MTTRKTTTDPKAAAAPVLYRGGSLSVAKRAADGGGDPADVIEVSMSSELPVARWFGDEILEHSKDAVDFSYSRDGLPLLVEHDRREQVGLVENVRLDGSRLVGEITRWSSAAAAQQVRQDILDGIRKNVSIGYRIDEAIERAKPGAKPDPETKLTPTEWVATRWTVMELSMVAVPADISVGVGRDGPHEAFATRSIRLVDSEGNRAMKDVPAGGAPSAPSATITVDEATKAERTRAAEISAWATQAGYGDKARGWIDEGLSLEAAKAKMWDLKVADAQKGAQPGFVDLSPREHKEYSITRALQTRLSDDWDRKGCLEREVSDAIGAKLLPALGRAPSKMGFFLPLNLRVPGEGFSVEQLRRRAPQLMVLERASVTGQAVGTNSLGGFAVATQLLPFIELLRNRMFTRAAGARVLTGLTSNIAFPRQITANTLTWTGENPTNPNTNTTLTLNQLSLAPKTGMVSTAFSRQVAIQSTPDMDAMILADLAQVFALGFDLAGINGSGSGNQPTGILNTAGVNVRALGTNGAIIDWANLVGLETDIANNNADIGALAYMTTPGQRGRGKVTLKNTVSGAAYLWEDGEINGYPAYATQQIPSNLTKGTSTTICHGYIFGNWAELIYGEWGGAVELIVDPYTVAGQNMIQLHGIGFIDVGVRRTQSFSVIKDALA